MSPTLITRLWDAQGGNCFHCGKPMLRTGHSNHAFYWSREHVYPRSRNGRNVGNIVLAHRRCNNVRGNPKPTRDEIDRASAIMAVVGLVPFPDLKPLPRLPLASVGDALIAALAEQPKPRRLKQIAFVGHGVEFGEYSTQAGAYIGRRVARDLERLARANSEFVRVRGKS